MDLSILLNANFYLSFITAANVLAAIGGATGCSAANTAADANTFNAKTMHANPSRSLMHPFDHGLPMESNRAAVSASLDARARATCTRTFWYCCPAVRVA